MTVPPICFQYSLKRELLVVGRRVGHHLVLPAVVDDQLALDVLEDGRVAGRVGDGEMDRPLHAVRGDDRDRAEGFLAHLDDGLVDGREIVEHVLCPGGDGNRGRLSPGSPGYSVSTR